MKSLRVPLFYVVALAAATIALTAPRLFADELSTPSGPHHQMMQGTTRTTADYVIPQVKLVRDDRKIVSLADELNDGRPVVLNFIYTTCNSICPMSSQTFSELQQKLGTGRDKVHLVSISIDPEQDTPEHLVEYAKRFGADSGWQHYSGSTAAIVATQRAFGVYRGDKMNHTPVTLFRKAPEQPWVRIDGFVTSDDLLNELRDSIASK